MTARNDIEAERLALLDHGVSFLCEDDWRNPYSGHPLAPKYRGKPYPEGKRISAHMSKNDESDALFAFTFLVSLEREAARRAQEQYAKAREVAARRVRAAQEPLVTIEPTTSVPSVEGIVAELERRTRLPIEEIRQCFTGARKSWQLIKRRRLVEEAVRELVKHHRMVHPVADRQERYGRRQWEQARGAWREFTGQRFQDQLVRQRLFETFGPAEGEVDFSVEELNGVTGRPIPGRTPRRVVVRVAEALGVTDRTVRTIIASEKDPYIVEGHTLSSQEGS